MIPIRAMAEHQVNMPLPITVSKYNAIAHLTYVSAFTDLIEPYLVLRSGDLNVRLARVSVVSALNVQGAVP
jgi:hypothetical protein